MNNFRFFFDRLDYFRCKGKGFSVFRASKELKDQFLVECKKLNVTFQTIQSTAEISRNTQQLANSDFIVVFQDLPYIDFIVHIQDFVDKIIFPLWYQKKSICFFSIPDKSEYLMHQIPSGLIHNNYDNVIRYLLCEQMMNLLERVNSQFTSPEFLHLNEDKTVLTPIELILKDALEKAELDYEMQLRIGGYFIDFLVTHNNLKTIVECDGRAYHTVEGDTERDKILSRESYRTLHFSGSEIYSNPQHCIDVIKSDSIANRNRQFEIDVDLDESQKKAKSFIMGPIRVLAPAGSGKTKTLINRIVHLINNGIPTERILALAFNKKASEEMKLRLANKHISDVEVRTFHSLGHEIVREKLGWTFDASTEQSVTRDLLKRAVQEHIQLPHRHSWDPLDAFLDALRRTKMELPPISEVSIEVEDMFYPFQPVFNSYLDLQHRHRFFNFDDMIYLAVRILLDDNILRKHYQNKFQYVLVDEFQDLNRAQLLFLQILSLPENNVFIVGDDDQMIYGWRGAEVRHIIDFNRRYAISQDCTLSTNYRSSKRIVYHSKWLIQHNQNRVHKDIHPKPDAQNGYLDIELGENLWEQAIAIATWIKKFKSEHQFNWKDFAVLFRFHAYQFPLAVVLDSQGIPHSPVNTAYLFKTRVGRDVYSYLSVVLHPLDALTQDFERVLKRPNKYFSNEIISTVKDWQAFQLAADNAKLRDWERDKLRDFHNRIETLTHIASQPTTTPHSLLTQLNIEVGLGSFYKDQSRLSVELDEANDEILFDVITMVAKNFNSLNNFYQHIHQSLQNDTPPLADEQVNRNEVVLTTIHKTKGNEYPNVVYYNLSQDFKLNRESDIEEERRVAYVGVTRARDNIFITALRSKVSIFLREITFNPELKSFSVVMLQAEIASNNRKLQKLQYIIDLREAKKKRLLQKFPELQGKRTVTSYTWLKRTFSWWRVSRIESATKKIDLLESEILSIKQDQMKPLIERIESLTIEVNFRNKIPVKKVALFT